MEIMVVHITTTRAMVVVVAVDVVASLLAAHRSPHQSMVVSMLHPRPR